MWAWMLFVVGFFLVAGCSSGPASLTLRPTDQKIAYAKTFDRAYAGRIDGSDAYVLLSDARGADQLRQVVYIKLLWRPMTGTRECIAANAAIDWYVINDANDDLLLYQGCGNVAINPGDDETKVTIRSGELEKSLTKGNLADPLGSARVNGTFVAQANDAKLRELLSDARNRVAAVASSAQGH
jgi:hypothetical protein